MSGSHTRTFMLLLSLSALAGIGLAALPVVLLAVASAFGLVHLLARAMGVSRRLGTLIAVGTAICGNSAVAAVGPAIGAKDDEMAYAVGCVTLFGLIALLVYPFASLAGFGDLRLAGLFLGTAIHDTAQVASAGMLAAQVAGSPDVLDVRKRYRAVVTALDAGVGRVIDQVDELGVPLASVSHSHDERTNALWNAALEEGKGIFDAAGASEVWTGPQGAMHIMGGTIMGADPGTSVTNSYGRLHDVNNLFVAGPGLFPTSAGVNPTFTLTALAARTAEHINDNWRSISGG